MTVLSIFYSMFSCVPMTTETAAVDMLAAFSEEYPQLLELSGLQHHVRIWKRAQMPYYVIELFCV